MRQSQLFSKTRKESPSDEVSKNAKLLIQAGFIHKEMAGVYAFLPLGLRVLEKMKAIVREEINDIGGQEIIMTTLQQKGLWEKTGRWDDEKVDVWFKSALHSGGEVGLGWSHEEPITNMMLDHVSSYRDLPIYVHQFQNKMRNELRAKSGIMRGREFIMNDLYSFNLSEEDHTRFYNDAIEAYKRIFTRIGIGEDTFLTFAPGGAFTEFSHEFQTSTDAGEDNIFINKEKNIAINEEVVSDEILKELGVNRDELEKVKTAEVGNIFNFGTEKCEQLGLVYKNEKGEQVPVWLGSYGIGITRLMGVLVEKYSDDEVMIWPKSVAPFRVHLLALGGNDDVHKAADEAYKVLQEVGIEVLYDDRDESPGEKFRDSHLIGIPAQIVIGNQTIDKDGVELTDRLDEDGTSEILPLKEVISRLS